MTVIVHQRALVGCDFDCEHSNVGVLERQMVVWLGCDLDFGSCLREEQRGREEEQNRFLPPAPAANPGEILAVLS